MPEDYKPTKSGKVNVKLPEVVGKGYGTFWRWKGRYRAVKGSRASKKSKTNVRDFYSTYYAAKGEYADYVKDVEEWNVNHVKKNENIPTEENRTDRYQIGEERNFMRDKDKEYLIKKR